MGGVFKLDDLLRDEEQEPGVLRLDDLLLPEAPPITVTEPPQAPVRIREEAVPPAPLIGTGGGITGGLAPAPHARPVDTRTGRPDGRRPVRDVLAALGERLVGGQRAAGGVAPETIPIEEAGPFRAGLALGGAQIVQTLGETGRRIGRALQEPPSLLPTARTFPAAIAEIPARVAGRVLAETPIPEAVERAGQALTEQAVRTRERLPAPEKGLLDPEATVEERLDALLFGVGQGLVSTVPSVVGGLGGAVVAGPTGAAIGAVTPAYLLNQSELQADLIQAGLPEDRAQQIADVGALPLAALDALPGLRLVGRLTGALKGRAIRWAVARAMADMADQGLLEGLTEGTQEFVQDLITNRATGRPLAGPRRYGEAALIGGTVGALTGAGAAVVSPAQERRAVEADRRQAEIPVEEERRQGPRRQEELTEETIRGSVVEPPTEEVRAAAGERVLEEEPVDLQADITAQQQVIAELEQVLETGRHPSGKDVTPAQRQHFERRLRESQQRLTELTLLTGGQPVEEAPLAVEPVPAPVEEPQVPIEEPGAVVPAEPGALGAEPETRLRRIEDTELYNVEGSLQGLEQIFQRRLDEMQRGEPAEGGFTLEAILRNVERNREVAVARGNEAAVRQADDLFQRVADAINESAAPAAASVEERGAPVELEAPQAIEPVAEGPSVTTPEPSERQDLLDEIADLDQILQTGEDAAGNRLRPERLGELEDRRGELQAELGQLEAVPTEAPEPAPVTPVESEEGPQAQDFIGDVPGWELTQHEFQTERANERTGQGRVLDAADEDLHEDIVRRAVERGEDVPPQVLRFYSYEPWAQQALEGRAEPVEEPTAEEQGFTIGGFYPTEPTAPVEEPAPVEVEPTPGMQQAAEELEAELGPVPAEPTAATAVTPQLPTGVQGTLEEAGQPASNEDLRQLYDSARERVAAGTLPTNARGVRRWAGEVLGRAYETGTWRTDDAYDAIEGALASWVQGNIGGVVGEPRLRRDDLQSVRQVEERLGKSRTRSEGMVARQQFSTPLDLARAAQGALQSMRGERILEPSAGTGNLVTALGDAQTEVNEIDPRRAQVLRLQGHERVTTEDALRLPLSGRRYNAVIMNPPFGGANLGKYRGFGATEFAASDISQRFVAQGLESLAPSGRLVAIMPRGYFNQSAAAFRNWLGTNHTLVAAIESPEGMYETRGTKFGTVMLVVDQGKARDVDPLIVRNPSWEQWYRAAEAVSDVAGRYQRTQDSHAFPIDVPAIKAPAQAERPVAALQPERAPRGAVPAAEPTPAVEEVPRATPEERPGEPAGRPEVAPGVGERPVEPGGRGPSPEPAEPQPEPGGGVPTGEPGPGVVAGGEPRGAATPAGAPAAAIPRVARGRVEPHPEDSPARRAEIEAANDSPVFAPYARGTDERRAPHPRLVVETRSMAGMHAPPITAQISSPAVNAAWSAERGEQGTGISDDQADIVLHVKNAWERGHGMLVADDVGVGKSREIGALILERVEAGDRFVLYTTASHANALNAVEQFRLVATGDPEGDLPYRVIMIRDYKQVLAGEAELPQPDGPTLYVIDSYNFAKAGRALAKIPVDSWLADEAHFYKNPITKRGIMWRWMHQALAARKGKLAYFTATPAITLDELGYLYGLNEWTPGGFADWVDRKLGRATAETDEDATDQAIRDQQEADAAVGEVSGTVFSVEALEGEAQRGAFNFTRPDVFSYRVTPAETEQVMRELKGAGKYLARDLWRGGVTFEVREIDMLGDAKSAKAARERYDRAAALVRDIYETAQKFGYLNKEKVGAGAVGIVRSLSQSYLKQLLFEIRLPHVLETADAALQDGRQVVISVHSVSGDVEAEEGLSADESSLPHNKRLEAAINQINFRHVEKEPTGDGGFEFVDLGDIPEALAARANLIEQLRDLEPLVDPIRTIEEHFGATNVAVVTGKTGIEKRVKMMGEFQSGQRKVALISGAGKTGIDLHDVNGVKRHMIVADYEWKADLFKQELGRVDRTGQKSLPYITLMATNLAAERKFAATIAARMASLGATSKGAAEATGTDALDQFDYSNDIAADAMRNAFANLPSEVKEHFTSGAFVERVRQEGVVVEKRPRKRANDASMKEFLLDLQMLPIQDAEVVLNEWMRQRDALMTGENIELLEARRTARAEGMVTRITTLSQDPALTLYEVQDANGQKYAIVQGFVTHFIRDIQEARGRGEGGIMKSRRYTQFTETASGGLVSGLELNTAEANRVKVLFGATGRTRVTPEDAWDDLMAGDKVKIHGPEGEEWILHHRRKDGRIEIRGAKVTKHRPVLKGLPVKYEPVGSFLYVEEDQGQLTQFLERFPPVQPKLQTVDTELVTLINEQARSRGEPRGVIGEKIRDALISRLESECR